MRHIIILICLCRLVETDGVNVVSVKEGGSVTLHTNVTDLRRQFIQWRFGPESTFIVIQFQQETVVTYFNYERFRDRLQIDNQSGSMTIRNTRTTDSGLYELQIMMHTMVLFNVTVYEHDHCCFSFTEAVIRLVISAVVGVATVVIVVYDITSRRAEQSNHHFLNDEP